MFFHPYNALEIRRKPMKEPWIHPYPKGTLCFESQAGLMTSLRVALVGKVRRNHEG